MLVTNMMIDKRCFVEKRENGIAQARDARCRSQAPLVRRRHAGRVGLDQFFVLG